MGVLGSNNEGLINVGYVGDDRHMSLGDQINWTITLCFCPVSAAIAGWGIGETASAGRTIFSWCY